MTWAPWAVVFVVELVACGGVVRETLDDGAGGAPAASGSGGEPSIIAPPSADAGPYYTPCAVPQRDVDVALPDPATLAAATFTSYCGAQIPDLSPATFDPVNFQIILPSSQYATTLNQVRARSDCVDYGHTYKGWYYDDNVHPTRIEFCPETCLEIGEVGGRVILSFGCYDPRRP